MSTEVRKVGEFTTRSSVREVVIFEAEGAGGIDTLVLAVRGEHKIAEASEDYGDTWNVELIHDFSNSFFVTNKYEAIDALEDIGLLYIKLLEGK